MKKNPYDFNTKTIDSLIYYSIEFGSYNPSITTITEIIQTGKIGIRYYEEEPKWYVQEIDDIIYAQPYLHSGKSPVFVIERGKDFFEYCSRHFSVIWNNSKDII